MHLFQNMQYYSNNAILFISLEICIIIQRENFYAEGNFINNIVLLLSMVFVHQAYHETLYFFTWNVNTVNAKLYNTWIIIHYVLIFNY